MKYKVIVNIEVVRHAYVEVEADSEESAEAQAEAMLKAGTLASALIDVPGSFRVDSTAVMYARPGDEPFDD